MTHQIMLGQDFQEIDYNAHNEWSLLPKANTNTFSIKFMVFL